MAQLNANTPYIECYVDNGFLYQSDAAQGSTYGYIFAVKSQINYPLIFHVQLCTGAVFWSVPLNRIKADPDLITLPPYLVQIWNSQSYDIAVSKFSFLENKKVDVRLYDKWIGGRYLFTIDNYDGDRNYLTSTYASHPDEKVYHFIELDTGHFGVYPNNHLRWHNKDFIIPYDKNNPPRYRPNKKLPDCEDVGATAGDDEQYFYNYKHG
jgi:hypothetical protein